MLIFDDQALGKYLTRWLQDGVVIDSKLYVKMFQVLYRITRVTKFRDFQYRLLLKKIIVNKDLAEWGIQKEDRCTFCRQHTETLIHLLHECQKVKPIVNFVYQLGGQNGEELLEGAVNFIPNNIHANPRNIINFVGLFAKQFVYRQRCQGKIPIVKNLVRELENYHKVEFANAKRGGYVKKHVKKWSPIMNFVRYNPDWTEM